MNDCDCATKEARSVGILVDKCDQCQGPKCRGYGINVADGIRTRNGGLEIVFDFDD